MKEQEVVNGKLQEPFVLRFCTLVLVDNGRGVTCAASGRVSVYAGVRLGCVYGIASIAPSPYITKE